MRGRPLIEWVCFVAVWTLLLIPLRHVTSGGAVSPLAAVESEGVVEGVRVPGWLRLTFSESPDSLVVYTGGDEIWREAAIAPETEQLLDLVIGKGGPDLEIELQWSHKGRRAVAVEVEPIEGRAWRALLWREAAGLRERLEFE